MRLEEENSHNLGSFQMLDVSDAEKEEKIQPESIEGGPEYKTDSETSTFKAKLISDKARYAIYSLGVVLGLLFFIDLGVSIYDVWQIHWVLGTVLLAAVIALVGYSARYIYDWLKGKNGIELVLELQQKTGAMKTSTSTYDSAHLFEEMRAYYAGTPQEKSYAELVSSLPDYLTDQERLEQFEDRYLSPLDAKVEKIIRRYSYQTGVAVAASPMPYLDAMLTIWRSALMINEIAGTYGIKPTLANRIRVLAKVGRSAAYSGLSQVALDKLIDLSAFPIAGKALSSAVQGIGAAVATARLGAYCALVCRPVPIDDADIFFEKLYQSIGLLLGRDIGKAGDGDEPK